MRIAVANLGGADLLDIHAKGPRHRGGTGQFLQPLIRQRGSDRAYPFEPGRHPGFSLQRAIKFLGILRQLGHIGGGAQLSDQACRMPGGAGCQRLTLQQHHILPAQFGQVIGHRTAHHAATNNDHTGLVGNVHFDLSNNGMTRRLQGAGKGGDMRGANFATATHNAGPLPDPTQRIAGINLGRQVAAGR